MARTVKIKEMPELGIEQPNMLHVQESYLRQIANGKPFTASKKRKSDVRATSAKWFRQKGTGRARQGERTNPHLYGGGIAFAPKPRHPKKKLNKIVRRSAQRSAVLWHINNDSAFKVEGKEFDGISKTKEMAEILGSIDGGGTICLVVGKDTTAWRSASNIPWVRLVDPTGVSVRDLVESACVVFSTNSLGTFKEALEAFVPEAETAPAKEEKPKAAKPKVAKPKPEKTKAKKEEEPAKAEADTDSDEGKEDGGDE